MALVAYFKNLKTGKRFKVLKMDKETNKITLQGRTIFEEDFDKEKFMKLGYTLVREEENNEPAESEAA